MYSRQHLAECVFHAPPPLSRRNGQARVRARDRDTRYSLGAVAISRVRMLYVVSVGII